MLYPDVANAELSVLEALWTDSPATIRQLTDRLYPDGTTSHYATVQKLLERLEKKHLTTRDRSETPHRFTAALSRDAFVAQRLHFLARQFSHGSFVPLLTSLIRSRSLSPRECQDLRTLFEQLQSSPPLSATPSTEVPAPAHYASRPKKPS